MKNNTDTVGLLKNRSKTRDLLRDVSFADIETIIRNLQNVADKKRDEQIRRQNAILEKARTGELNTYHYQDESGQDATWVGPNVGVLPRSFRNYLNRTGLNRKDCLKEELSEG